jgi:hypothetical protein
MGYWAAVEPIWKKVSIYEGPEVFLRQYAASPLTSRVLLAAHWCQSEVNNGGFSQFFGNSTGVLAPEAAQAFEALGMPKVAALVKRAMEFFGPEYLRECGSREDAFEAYVDAHGEDAEDPFASLDDEFFELIKSEAGGFRASADAYARGANG